MRRKQIVLYVPGLGDHNLNSQKRALRLWKIYRVQSEICAMDWHIDESWNKKLEKLLKRIDYHIRRGNVVSLVGISAGSNAALQALIKRRDAVSAVVLVCPKFQYPETVHPLRYKMNPALKEAIMHSMQAVKELSEVDKSKIKTFIPMYDNFLPTKESYIPGVKREIMPAITHIGGIAYAITLGSWRIINYIRKRSAV